MTDETFDLGAVATRVDTPVIRTREGAGGDGVNHGMPSAPSNPVCTIDGCDRRHKARGWCAGHHERWYRTGDVRADVPLRPVRSRPVIADADHGTMRGYNDGCGCDPCTREATRYTKRYRHDGRRRTTEAGPVQQHARRLLDSGWTFAQLVAGSGLASGTVSNVLYTPRQRVNVRTAEAILDLEPAGRTVWLDPGPLLDLIAARGVTREGLGATDAKALHRARRSGRLSDVIADRVAIRVLGLTLEEIYGPGWDQEVAA